MGRSSTGWSMSAKSNTENDSAGKMTKQSYPVH